MSRIVQYGARTMDSSIRTITRSGRASRFSYKRKIDLIDYEVVPLTADIENQSPPADNKNKKYKVQKKHNNIDDNSSDAHPMEVDMQQEKVESLLFKRNLFDTNQNKMNNGYDPIYPIHITGDLMIFSYDNSESLITTSKESEQFKIENSGNSNDSASLAKSMIQQSLFNSPIKENGNEQNGELVNNEAEREIAVEDAVSIEAPITTFQGHCVGDLLWARMSKYPYWPCILKCIHETPRCELQVQFFADNGRHAFVAPNAIMAFKGMDDFMEQKSMYEKQKKLHNYQTRFGFRIKESIKPTWNQAVEEANACATSCNRLTFIDELVAKQNMNKIPKIRARRSSINNEPNLSANTSKESKDSDMISSEATTSTNRRSRRVSSLASVASSAISEPIPVNPPVKVVKNPRRKISIEDLCKFYVSNASRKCLRDVKKEQICRSCFSNDESTGNIVACDGWCGGFYHTNCLQLFLTENGASTTVDKRKLGKYYCANCNTKQGEFCFRCQLTESTDDNSLKMCSFDKCKRFYHIQCAKSLLQSKSVNKFICPSHLCHTCTHLMDITDFETARPHPTQTLARCIKCPATFHNNDRCLAAGTKLYSYTDMLCPLHTNVKPASLNVCMYCEASKGGKIMSCKTCPLSAHAECCKVYTDPWYCDSCTGGRLPIYGELVWCKFGVWKRWPSITVPPYMIPEHVMTGKARQSFVCVFFLGTHNYGWIPRPYMYSYSKDDNKEEVDPELQKSFIKAVSEAREVFARFTELKSNEKELKTVHEPKKFQNIVVNHYASNALKRGRSMEIFECTCSSTNQEYPCSTLDCLNRSTQVECYKCSPNCQNQRFSKRQWAAVYTKRVDKKGYGLFAKEAIKADTFVIEYVGEVIDTAEFTRRKEVKAKNNDNHYYFLHQKNTIIDADLRGNNARFINHSCDPNCEVDVWMVKGVERIGFFSRVDIAPDTEITIDYKFDTNGLTPKVCYCQSKNCTGFMGKLAKKKK